MSCGAIDYCLTILKSLLEYWRQISPDEVRRTNLMWVGDGGWEGDFNPSNATHICVYGKITEHVYIYACRLINFI